MTSKDKILLLPKRMFVHWVSMFMFYPLSSSLVMLVLSKGRKVSDGGYTVYFILYTLSFISILVMLVLSKGRKVSDGGYTDTGLSIPSLSSRPRALPKLLQKILIFAGIHHKEKTTIFAVENTCFALLTTC